MAAKVTCTALRILATPHGQEETMHTHQLHVQCSKFRRHSFQALLQLQQGGILLRGPVWGHRFLTGRGRGEQNWQQQPYAGLHQA